MAALPPLGATGLWSEQAPTSIAPDTSAADDQALKAFTELARLEGIIPALESAHAVAEVMRRAPTLAKDRIVIINLSGRGDKDVAQAANFIKL